MSAHAQIHATDSICDAYYIHNETMQFWLVLFFRCFSSLNKVRCVDGETEREKANAKVKENKWNERHGWLQQIVDWINGIMYFIVCGYHHCWTFDTCLPFRYRNWEMVWLRSKSPVQLKIVIIFMVGCRYGYNFNKLSSLSIEHTTN